MRLSAPLLLLLAWSALAHGNDADYRLQLPDRATYRLHQPELLKLSEVEQRAARRQVLGGLPFADQIQHAADAGGIEAELLHAVVQAESAYNPRAVSPKGALGLAQMMPGTARAYGVSDALKPADNLRASALHLRDLLDHFGRIDLVLSAYNAGAGAVKKYGGVPPYTETRAYVPKVSGRYEELKRRVAEAEPAPPQSPYRLKIDGAELRLAQPR
jgi:soluble lytic murein transglycosylase-like protein